MKNNKILLPVILVAVLFVALLTCLLVRVWLPAAIIPTLNIPNMVLLSVVALLIVIYVRSSKHTGDQGATTEVAALLAFSLGALAVYGLHLEAAIAAVVIAVLLGAKEKIHGLLRRLSRLELNASLQLLVIALVVLPLLPNEPLGPWDSINPRVIGWLVMLLAVTGRW